MTDASALEVRDLTVSYDDSAPVLVGVNATFESGRLTGIVGPNGAGKSTLIKAILGLLPADAGRVSVFGASLREGQQRVVSVPQRASIDWDSWLSGSRRSCWPS